MGGPAIVGCLHMDPAQLMQLSGVYIWTQPGYSKPPPSTLYQLYNGRISPSTVGVRGGQKLKKFDFELALKLPPFSWSP